MCLYVHVCGGGGQLTVCRGVPFWRPPRPSSAYALKIVILSVSSPQAISISFTAPLNDAGPETTTRQLPIGDLWARTRAPFFEAPGAHP